jgi:hypothetical protein
MDQLKSIVDSRWFALADLLVAFGSGVIWYFQPQWGWKVLLIALLPWMLRLLAGRPPFKLTPFEIPIIVYLISAIIGAQQSYDPSAGWAKFWIILASILLFYALAGQPRENTWIIAASMVTAGVVVTIVFLLVYDWQAHPVKLGVINQIGSSWMAVRPSLAIATIKDEDIISNILLVLSPFPILLIAHALLDGIKKDWLFWLGVFSAIVFLIGLGMAAMLQAVIFGIFGSLVFLWWGLNSWLDRKGANLSRKVFFIVSGLVLLEGLFFIIRFPDGALAFGRRIPFTDGFDNRFIVIDNMLHLTRDYLLTGGGLAAFPGLYSSYILGIPDLFIAYGSNLFLQIVIEHGVFGSIAYLSIIVGGILILLHHLYFKEVWENRRYLVLMTLVGYTAVLVVGMFDAILYNGSGIMCLFVIPGFAVFTQERPKQKFTGGLYPIFIFSASVIFFLLGIRGKVLPNYYADLGAVEMAKLDHEGRTFDQFIEPQAPEKYGEAVDLFEKALLLEPGNQTANYRLGLLAYRKGDYLTACPYLEKAHEADPGNRGIIKKLGYSYVWSGEIDQAEKFLMEIPEAGLEMDYFIWWWGTQNRKDLSEYAFQMVQRLIQQEAKGNN